MSERPDVPAEEPGRSSPRGSRSSASRGFASLRPFELARLLNYSALAALLCRTRSAGALKGHERDPWSPPARFIGSHSGWRHRECCEDGCSSGQSQKHEDRAIPGHWEDDLLAGAANSSIATLVERSSRYVLLIRLRGKETRHVVQALTRRVRRLPVGLMASLTWDLGYELAAHRTFSIATGVQVYFCDPQSPWQRGSNENTNGLLRQYMPRRTDLSRYQQPQLDAIAHRLNTRPRKTLGYRTPADRLAEIVAPTA